MSVPDMIRNMTKFVEKAKDLPLRMLQTSLSGVGQALLLGDRMRTKIKGLGAQDEDLDESRQKATDQLAKPDERIEEKAEEKPARREPVIFAPAKPKPAEPAVTKAPQTKPAEAKAPAADDEVKSTEPESATPPAVKAETPKAETPKAETKVTEPETAKVEAAKVEAAKVEAAKVEAAKVEAAKVEAAKVTETETPKPPVSLPVIEAIAVPTEPMPGHAELTLASLRARMRGKTAVQIQELLDYERATSAREAVVRMYENRLVKLEAAE